MLPSNSKQVLIPRFSFKTCRDFIRAFWQLKNRCSQLPLL